MEIVWDERKRARNFETHGFDFAQVKLFDWEHAIIRPSHSDRLKAIGYVGPALVALVFKPLGTEGISIVSMRSASRNERRLHGAR